jgi:hypothetical protein
MKKILSIVLGVGVFIGILLIVMFLEGFKKPSEMPAKTPSPTSSTKQPSQQAQKSAPVNYDKNPTDKLLQTINTRPTPSVNDSAIRASLIESLNGKSGILYTSLNVTLEYVKSPNDFEGEIKTDNVSAAKQEVEVWFKNKGLTNDGICKLPLFFYLNGPAAQKLKGTGVKFSPLPDNC